MKKAYFRYWRAKIDKANYNRKCIIYKVRVIRDQEYRLHYFKSCLIAGGWGEEWILITPTLRSRTAC